MEELLKALQEANELPEPNVHEENQPRDPIRERIDVLACDLFITKEGRINYAQVNEFEKYAPCKMFPAERDSFGWVIGGINYNGRKYYFG